MSASELAGAQSPLRVIPRPGGRDLAPTTGAVVIQKVLSGSIYVLASLIGLAAFIYPFFTVTTQVAAASAQVAHGADSPLMLALLIGLCLAAMAVETQGQVINAKMVALLGILVAINSALRFAEAVVRGPGGFTPVFMLIIVCGYVFGGRFGFLMGILSLLVSAIITGGIGPWLPYQMFTAGWMGMSAGWLGALRNRLSRSQQAGPVQSRTPAQARWSKLEIIVLCVFGAVWGFLYGAIMNLWFWPFQAGDPAQSWQAGLGFIQGVQRYLAFYMATSAWWDVFAAVGNIALLGLFGLPTLKALQRFKNRFMFSISPATLAAERH
ncbi:MAG: ECF transporter S component [Chloroflexi bacterium]|nr:ECF transporter S component [Chloroflexota bacterium]